MRDTGENGPETRRSHRQRRLGVPIVDNSFPPISLAYAFASIPAPSDLSDESDQSDQSQKSRRLPTDKGEEPIIQASAKTAGSNESHANHESESRS
jgi:hypothetical protein